MNEYHVCEKLNVWKMDFFRFLIAGEINFETQSTLFRSSLRGLQKSTVKSRVLHWFKHAICGDQDRHNTLPQYAV